MFHRNSPYLKSDERSSATNLLPIKVVVMDNVVLNPLPPEEQERLKRFQEELEGQELTVLLERIQQQFDLSVNQIAVAAGMDESALHKILKGENREFKAEHVDALLDYLEQQGKLKYVYELAIWKRALRVSAFLHFDIYKVVEPRLRKIEDTAKRIEALKAYLREQYPALAETYDKSGGTFPVFVPLFDVVARMLNERFKQQSSQTTINHLSWSNVINLMDMEFMRVPAGKFIMGSEKYNDEKPQHTVDIPYDYWIGRFPVTNEQYNAYAKANGINQSVSDWEKKKDHPVVNISWNTAMKYCQWLNNLLKIELPSGLTLRLPTEAEWEKAARGTDGREYPWGNTIDKSKCNAWESDKYETVSVGLYSPQGDSPYSCADMSGIVWEWTHSEYKAYPYNIKDGREDEKKKGFRVIRGDALQRAGVDLRCACRNYLSPNYAWGLQGFRVVVTPISF